MVELEALDIGYRSRQGDRLVARQIDLSLDAGEFMCILGPNGAGKSTLMRTIAGMQPALAGRIRVAGRDLAEISARDRARLIGVVLTERVTAGLLTSYTLVGLGRYPYTKWRGRLSKRDHEIILDSLRMAGAIELAHRFVRELSDGERQRVMLARALAQQPQLLILDEITAFLDLPRRVEIMALLKQLAHDSGCSIMISTHDLDLALRHSDRIWLIDGEGAVCSGAPEDLVLAGELSATFSDERIVFDPHRGVLQSREQAGPWIALGGKKSIRYEWTQRALERCGFRLWGEAGGPPEDCPRVDLLDDEVWRLQEPGSSRTFDSLYDLTSVLASFRDDTD